MKLNFKNIIYIVILAILLGLFPTNKALATSEKPILSIESTKEKVVPGEEVTVEVKFNNNNVSDCYGFDFKLQYDTNILEVIDSEIVIKTGASAINDKAPDSVNLVLVSISPIEYNGTLIKVTFKVKENANNGETILNILPNNSKAPISNEEEDIETTVYPKKFTIESKNKEPIKNTNNDNKNQDENQIQYKETNNSNTNEDDGIQIKYNSNITNQNIEENIQETEEPSEVNKEQKEKVSTGLPTIAIVVLIIISIGGIILILTILKKKKK